MNPFDDPVEDELCKIESKIAAMNPFGTADAMTYDDIRASSTAIATKAADAEATARLSRAMYETMLMDYGSTTSKPLPKRKMKSYKIKDFK